MAVSKSVPGPDFVKPIVPVSTELIVIVLSELFWMTIRSLPLELSVLLLMVTG